MPGADSSAKRMKTLLTACVFTVTAIQIAVSETLYDITFSQFSDGAAYTNATGGPFDFASYGRGYADYAQIVSNFSGLADQPLMNMTTGVSSESSFTMDTPGYTNHILALSFDFALQALPPESNGPRASIGFSSSRAIGDQQTVVEVLFGWSRTNGGTLLYTHAEVVSREGPNNLPTILFATNSSFLRNTPNTLALSLNTRAHQFDVTLNGTPLASAAPFGSSQQIEMAGVSLGNFYPPYGAGAAIDNVRLDVTDLDQPYFSTAMHVGGDIAIGITNLAIGSTNHVLSTPSLIFPVWSTESTFEATSRSTNWLGTLSETNAFYQLKSER